MSIYTSPYGEGSGPGFPMTTPIIATANRAVIQQYLDDPDGSHLQSQAHYPCIHCRLAGMFRLVVRAALRLLA